MKKDYRLLLLIIASGLAIRVIFTLFFAESYFGEVSVHVHNDTHSWAHCITNFVEHGEYMRNLDDPESRFARMPGYSFFIGIFYLISGREWAIAFPMIGWAQIIFDGGSILLMFLISKSVFKNSTKPALWASALYAFYPFIFVWSPVVQSETMSVFWMLLGIYFFVKPRKTLWPVFLSAVFLSLAALTRLNIVFLFFPLGLMLLFNMRKSAKSRLIGTAVFVAGFLLIYGAWPARNYLKYDRFIFNKSVAGYNHFKEDYRSFRKYMYSIQRGIEPQFTQLIRNQAIDLPEIAFTSPEDSIKLMHTIELARTCGSGFSRWKGYWKDPVPHDSSCNDQIASNFKDLKKSQMKAHPLHYWIILPLKNLQKAMFKLKLEDAKTTIQKAASLLFIYRSILLMLGLIGAILMWRHKLRFSFVVFLYFLMIYGYLCVFVRHLEMRYFLPADILLLLPAAFLIYWIVGKFSKPNLQD